MSGLYMATKFCPRCDVSFHQVDTPERAREAVRDLLTRHLDEEHRDE